MWCLMGGLAVAKVKMVIVELEKCYSRTPEFFRDGDDSFGQDSFYLQVIDIENKRSRISFFFVFSRQDFSL